MTPTVRPDLLAKLMRMYSDDHRRAHVYILAWKWRDARAVRDWKAADEIRDDILSLGFQPVVDQHGLIDVQYDDRSAKGEVKALRERGFVGFDGRLMRTFYLPEQPVSA